MSIDQDLLAVLQEVGTPITIYKPDSTVITGEYIDFLTHTEHTTPLIRGFFVDVTLQHPTQVEIGDVIEYGDGTKLIILARAAERFEGNVVDYLASGYYATSAGKFQHYVADAGFDADYNKIKGWVDLHTSVQGCMMDRLFRSNVVPLGNQSLEVELDRLHLYVSAYYNDVKMGMRWETDAGDKYKVDQIEPYRLPGIWLVFLSEDTRAD